jgi:hypothetical protein
MIVVPKKDLPKDINPMGLKRGDVIQVEIADATPDYLTIDPATLKLALMRDPNEPRESHIKEPKPKKDSLASMPLPDLKMALQNPPAPGPVATPAMPPMPPAKQGM